MIVIANQICIADIPFVSAEAEDFAVFLPERHEVRELMTKSRLRLRILEKLGGASWNSVQQAYKYRLENQTHVGPQVIVCIAFFIAILPVPPGSDL